MIYMKKSDSSNQSPLPPRKPRLLGPLIAGAFVLVLFSIPLVLAYVLLPIAWMFNKLKRIFMNKPKKITVDYIDDYTKWLALESVKLISSVSKDKTKNYYAFFMTRFIKHLIDVGITNTLAPSTDPNLDNEAAYNMAVKDLKEFKYLLQLEVGEGFASGMSRFSNTGVEYYCSIMPSPTARGSKYN